MRIALAGLALIAILAPGSNATALSVDEAYQAIPHRQTTFDPESSTLAEREKRFLDRIFALTDRAMAARVEQLSNLYYYEGQGDTGIATYNQHIDALLDELKALNPPGKLKKHYDLVIQSIEEQRRFLQEWSDATQAEKARIKNSYTRAPLVRSSHHKLLASYKELMRHSPRETKHNQQAFFDHLCALDFL